MPIATGVFRNGDLYYGDSYVEGGLIIYLAFYPYNFNPSSGADYETEETPQLFKKG